MSARHLAGCDTRGGNWICAAGCPVAAQRTEKETTMAEPVPKPWPELTQPTAEQWLDWLLAHDRAGQVALAQRVLDTDDAVMRCMLADHRALAEQVDALTAAQRDAAAEYQRGWSDAMVELERRLNEEFDAKYPKADR